MNKKTGGPEELIACSICGRAGTWSNYLVWFLSVVVQVHEVIIWFGFLSVFVHVQEH